MTALQLKEQENLEKLEKQVNECSLCEISQQITNKVFGEGPSNANIMSISEAPGQDEDVAGRPYVGKAGKYWEQMLHATGLDRSTMHVCNTLCCRPVNNEYAEDLHEADNCKQYLQQRIEIVKPKLIILFGKLAGYALDFITKKGFKKPYGKMLGEKEYTYTADGEEYTIPVIWTYHPSYLIRTGSRVVYGINPNWESYLHLVRAREILDGLDNRQT
jgi:uracil-DNA glycosylase